MDHPNRPQSPKPSGEKRGDAPKAQPEQPSTAKGVKETIESILIAFILAFVFRAFVVEAFVIPTGSMATTLLGAHMHFGCPECGKEFDVGFQVNEEIDIPTHSGSKQFTIICENCKFQFPANMTTNVPVHYGDRILVLKYLYIPWISSPQRWDVVVFKNPTDIKGDFSQNYIKRLVGLPGEELMILDGDLYVKKNGQWEVQAKPQHAQEALWRLVYDNDYRPRENPGRIDGWRMPWMQAEGSSGWDTGDAAKAKDFVFNNLQSHGVLNFDASAALDRGSSIVKDNILTDWLVYNHSRDSESGNPYQSRADMHPVGDQKLEFFYERQAGDGDMVVTMTKPYNRDAVDEFHATFSATKVGLTHVRKRKSPFREGPGTIERDSSTREVVIGADKALPQRKGPIRVEFENVDYRVTLRIDGEVVYRTTPQQYAPELDLIKARRNWSWDQWFDARPKVSIAASKQQAKFSHVSLWRDVYYTTRAPMLGTIDRPVVLKPDEYFVLGDNSAASQDARFWDNPVHLPNEALDVEAGRVPGRFLLGKAFFVYWPAGYRVTDKSPGVVPNFGKMRLIH